jgi:endonuclease III
LWLCRNTLFRSHAVLTRPGGLGQGEHWCGRVVVAWLGRRRNVARSNQDALVRALLDRHGRTYADEAGIRLADKPAAVYQLLVLAVLLSARIRAGVAVAAARELFAAGCRNPQAMAKASWQDRVDSLGRGHYRRYDERTSTMLGDGAQLLIERWGGDLRRAREAAGGSERRLRRFLTEVPGIGDVGADIFLREVQTTWPEFAPFFDQRARDAAKRLGLPNSPGRLAGLVGERDLARFAAALVRVALDAKAAEAVRRAAA